ncbi:MAG TPA: hypothetical protein VFQ61_35705 [Polyangiaceae bacterium]|nr:hypothetical protein [Polyangiaceae bacterium]
MKYSKCRTEAPSADEDARYADASNSAEFSNSAEASSAEASSAKASSAKSNSAKASNSPAQALPTVVAMSHNTDALQKVSVRTDVLALLREKRYEDALALLYRARSEAPADRELQKSIDQIKEFLVGAYAKRLGGLDRVATPIPSSAVRSPDVVLLSRYVDGTSTFGDIAQMCPLGQLRTLQVLVGLYSMSSPPQLAGLSGRREPEPPLSGLRTPPEQTNTLHTHGLSASPFVVHPAPQAIAETEDSAIIESDDLLTGSEEAMAEELGPPGTHTVVHNSEPDDLPAPETARSASFASAAPLSAEENSEAVSAPPNAIRSAPVTMNPPVATREAPEPGPQQPNSYQPSSYQPSSYQPGSYQPGSYQPGSRGPFSSQSGVESESTRQYNDSFAAATAAFVQGRYQEAVEAFEFCVRLRPGDRAAEVMLRRARRDFQSRS